MNSSQRCASVILISLFAILFAGVAKADPPGRAVDLRYISGQVSVQPGGVNDWVAAVINRPLTTADRVWADKDSRAELHLGSSALRINAETSMTLTNVNDQTVQVELDQGTLNLWIRHLYGGEIYEVDTPNLAFTVTKPGDYRFDVNPDGDTTIVAARHGEGEATGQGNAIKVRSGQQVTFSNGNSLEHQVSGLPHPDGFDDWCRVRDQREEHSASERYVSPDVVGADDLDQYGTWRVEAGYGEVWIPSGVGPGWAPYHNGHWIWVDPWGWTWVDDAPWGYAPCHYGRWVFYGGAWGWSPGPLVVGVRPVYAPALVAWVGGAHWGVSVGFGGGVGVGWFPLGYGEPYVPSYAVSRNYFRNVNVSNTRITNITNVTNNYYTNNSTTINNRAVTNIRYANQRVPGAMTAVPASALANSQSVARVAVPIRASEAARAPMATTAEVAPARASVLGGNVNGNRAIPPSRAVSRQVVTRTAPPPRPVPFEAKQQALAKTPGRPLDARTEQQIRTQLPPRSAETPGRPAQGAGGPNPGTRNVPANNPNPGMGNVPGGNATNSNGKVVARPPNSGVNAGQPNNGARMGANPSVQNAPATNPNPGARSVSGGNPPSAKGRVVPRPPNAGGANSSRSADNGGRMGSNPSVQNAPSSSPNPGARNAPGGKAPNAAGRVVPRPPNAGSGSPARPANGGANMQRGTNPGGTAGNGATPNFGRRNPNTGGSSRNEVQQQNQRGGQNLGNRPPSGKPTPRNTPAPAVRTPNNYNRNTPAARNEAARPVPQRNLPQQAPRPSAPRRAEPPPGEKPKPQDKGK